MYQTTRSPYFQVFLQILFNNFKNSGIFNYCVDDAIERSREKGIEPDQLACTLNSDFLDYDIWVPFRFLTYQKILIIKF